MQVRPEVEIEARRLRQEFIARHGRSPLSTLPAGVLPRRFCNAHHPGF